jgi:hypothetical protein
MKVLFSRATQSYDFSEQALAAVEGFGRTTTINQDCREAASKEFVADVERLQFETGRSFDECFARVLKLRPRLAKLTRCEPVRSDGQVELAQ